MDDILSSIDITARSSSKRRRTEDEDDGSGNESSESISSVGNRDNELGGGNEDEQQNNASQGSSSQSARPAGAQRAPRRAQANANLATWAQRHARSKKLRREQIVEVDQFINVRHR